MASPVFLSEMVGGDVSRMGAPLAILGLQIGRVTDNADPASRYRVKATIPGVIDGDAETDWMIPLGTAGGGSPQRGGFVVPAIGSKIAVLFHNGDHESPYYLCGGWYDDPDAGGVETPQAAKDAGTDAHRIAALQIGRFSFAVDERDDKLTFTASATGDDGGGIGLTLDFANRGIALRATTAILLETLGIIHLNATTVRVQDRLVATSPRPI